MLEITEELELELCFRVDWYTKNRSDWSAVGLIMVNHKDAAVVINDIGYAIVTKSEIYAISYDKWDAAVEGKGVFPKHAFNKEETYDLKLIDSILHNFGFNVNYY